MRKNVQFLRFLVLSGLLLLTGISAHSQSVLINPLAEGGFELGPTFADNGWTVVNTATVNGPQWFTTAAPLTNGGYSFTPTGSNAAYISSDLGTSWSYQTPSAASGASHFYRDVTFPAGEAAINLSFRFNASGESTWDDIHIYLCPTTLTPVANAPTGTSTAPTWSGTGTPIFMGRFNLLSAGSGTTVNLPLSASVIGNCSASATWRLVFTWKNDAGGGTNPPASIDDISLLSSPSPINLAGGNYTIDNMIPTGGTNFNSFTEAIVALNSANTCGAFTGPVVFDVTAGQVFIETPPAITATGSSIATITFQKNGASNATIIPTGTTGTSDGGIIISGGDYFTFDGIDINASAVTNVEYGYIIRNASATNGAQFNTIKNCSINMSRNTTTSTSSCILQSASATGGGVTPTAATGANSDNMYLNLTLNNAVNGVYLNGNATYRDLNTIVATTACGTRNTITNMGPQASTFVASRGIYIANQENAQVYNNDVSNVAGNQSASAGIFATGLGGNNQIYNNNVSNVSVGGSASTTSAASGMNISLATTGTHNVRIYNNTVANVYTSFTGAATASRYALGIAVGTGAATSSYDVDNNSVSIGNTLAPTYSNTCFSTGGSTAIYNVRANIFANFTQNQTAPAKHTCYATSAAATFGATTSVTSYNDLYVANDLGTSGFTAVTNTTNRTTIADFTTAMAPAGLEANSISNNPLYVNNDSDLHAQAMEVSGLSYTPSGWIINDIDCEDRSTLSPNDLGADAFNVTICTGTPDPSVTVSSVPTVCPNTNFLLTLSTTYSGVGITYNWQSSPDGVTYTSIPGATDASLLTDQSVDTYYQCVVTCTYSGLSITSTPVFVQTNSFLNCYCTSNATNTADTDIGNVTFGTLNNGTATPTTSNPTAVNTFTDYTGLTPEDFELGATYPISVSQITAGGTFYAARCNVFIDYNQDGVFDNTTERVYSGGPTSGAAPTVSGNISIPLTATLGITRMRVILRESGTATDPACGTYTYGETEDYFINLVCPTLTAPTTVGESICSGFTATLTATPSIGTISWYDAASGGTMVGTGNNFTTPTLLANTSYWAQEDFTGCPSGPRTETIATVDPVNVPLTAVNATCNGANDGSFTAGTPLCGTAPFTYSVDGGAFGPIPTNLAPGTYSIVVQDNGGFQSTAQSIVISEPSWTVLNPTSGGNASVCVGDASALLNATGSLSTSTTTTQTYTFGTSVAVAGNATINLSVNPVLPPNATVTGTTLLFNGVSTTGGEWPSDMMVSLSGASTLSSVTMAAVNSTVTNANYTRTPSLLNNAGGLVNFTLVNTYSGTATINSIELQVTYSVPDPAVVTWYDALSGGNMLGTGNSIEAVGTSVLPNTMTPGTYNFFAEASNAGCTSPSRTLVTVTVNALPTVDAGTNATICAGTSITLSGSGATTYTWDNGVTDGVAFIPSATTTYNVTGTDANGCVNTDMVTINVNALPTIDAGLDVAVCEGGSVTLTATSSEPVITWNNGIMNGVAFTPASTTTYTASVTDGNGCSNTDMLTVTVNALPTVSAGADFAICDGDDVVLMGTGASTYSWDNGVIDGFTFNPVSTATYTVTGTDLNGCTNTDDVIVTVNPLPQVLAGLSQTICIGESVVLSGSGALTYTWTNGAIDGVAFSPSITGSYTVTGTDVNGCTNYDITSVYVNALPMVDAGSDLMVCENQAVILTATGADTYSWDNGVMNGQSFIVTSTMTYTVVGTDINGCTNSDDVTVTANPLPMVEAGDNVSQCGDQSVTLTASGAVTYAWNNGVMNGVAFNAPFGATSYIVTGYDANGCSATDIVTVTIGSVPTASASVNGLTLSSSNTNVFYQWIDCSNNSAISGATSATFTVDQNGSYAVVVTTMDGCSDTSACILVDYVGLGEIGNEVISVYPNPTRDKVTISMPSDNAVIEVADAQGKVVINRSISNNEQIDLSSFESGIYIFKINSDKGTSIHRISKN